MTPTGARPGSPAHHHHLVHQGDGHVDAGEDDEEVDDAAWGLICALLLNISYLTTFAVMLVRICHMTEPRSKIFSVYVSNGNVASLIIKINQGIKPE